MYQRRESESRQNPSAGAGTNAPAPNPYAPVSYSERLNAPLKMSTHSPHSSQPLRPGQFYGYECEHADGQTASVLDGQHAFASSSHPQPPREDAAPPAFMPASCGKVNLPPYLKKSPPLMPRAARPPSASADPTPYKAPAWPPAAPPPSAAIDPSTYLDKSAPASPDAPQARRRRAGRKSAQEQDSPKEPEATISSPTGVPYNIAFVGGAALEPPFAPSYSQPTASSRSDSRGEESVSSSHAGGYAAYSSPGPIADSSAPWQDGSYTFLQEHSENFEESTREYSSPYAALDAWMPGNSIPHRTSGYPDRLFTVDEIADFFEDKRLLPPADGIPPTFIPELYHPPPPYAPPEWAVGGDPEQNAAPVWPESPPALREPSSPSPERPPVRPWRVLSLVAAAVMLVFCFIVGGRILVDLSKNEKEMKEVRSQYLERQGVTLEQDAVRVDLPPPGVTFNLPAEATPSASMPTNDSSDVNGLLIQGVVAPTDTAAPTPAAPPKVTAKSYPDNPMKNIVESMSGLHEQYPDVVGRLVIEGVLNEVVVKRNNTFYLTRKYTGSASKSGSVFVDESCSIERPPENLLLRGQSAFPGEVFGPLWQYQTGGRSFASAARTATLTTLYEERRYELLAVIVADSDPNSPGYFNFASQPSFISDAAMLQYVQLAREHSLYPFNVDVVPGDRLLTLSTFSNGAETQCLVLLFRMVP